MRLIARALMAAALMAAASASAQTAAPGASQHVVIYSYNGTDPDQPRSLGSVSQFGDGSTALDIATSPSAVSPYARVTANPFGVPSVSATSLGDDGWYIAAAAEMSYFLQLGGADAGLDVPILYAGRLTATATAGSGPSAMRATSAHGELTLSLASDPAGSDADPIASYAVGACAEAFCDGAPDDALAVTGTVMLHAGELLSVRLSTGASSNDGGTAYAYVDPYFRIDPTFLAANPGYALTFSDNVGNDPLPTAVPEPTTWATMIAGFALLGGAMRRRRWVAEAVAA